MLGRQRIIKSAEVVKIIRGLHAVQQEIETGRFVFSSADEDVHMNIERRLTEKIGPVGGKLHTARSRNDQVALDMRLFLREELGNIGESLAQVCKVCARRESNLDAIMPGYPPAAGAAGAVRAPYVGIL